MKLLKFFPIILLVAVELLIFATNYKPGTYLLGWDNLHPELNYAANFKRNIFALWQEYRGLGVLDGMAHSTNFVHTSAIWLLDLFLPKSVLRYVFVLSMHFLGGFGMYKLLVRIFKKPPFLVPLTGALFYLLNIATVQMFFAPFEVFTVHFAALPWLILLAISYLEKARVRTLFLFALVSYFSSPQALVPTLFIAYLITIGWVMFFSIFRGWKAIARVLALSFTLILINAYWLFLYGYSAYKNGPVIAAAKINQMSSPDIYAKNHAKGNFLDVFYLRGFMLDVQEYQTSVGFAPIMASWREYLKLPMFWVVATVFLALSGVGIVVSIARRRTFLFPFLATLATSVFFLGNDIWGLEAANTLLRTTFPLIGEAFRFPFTKFSIVFVFCYSLFAAYGLSYILEKIPNFLKSRLARPSVAFLLLFFLLYSYPVWKTGFFFDFVRVKVPSEYFQTIEYFKDQDSSLRVMTLPQPSFWNWKHYRWGARGSGFLWYGIEQPMLERAFDPWSDKNENYYWELSQALYSQDLESVEKIVEKYQISYVLFDENITNPGNAHALYTEQIGVLLSASSKFSLDEQFGGVKIYKTNLSTPVSKFVYSASHLPAAGPSYKWTGFDAAYLQNGNYVSSTALQDYYYPFRSLFTGRGQEDVEFSVSENETEYVFSAVIPEEMLAQNFEVPDVSDELPVAASSDLKNIDYRQPEVVLQGDVLKVLVPKVDGVFTAAIHPSLDKPWEGPDPVVSCDPTLNGRASYEKQPDGYIRFFSRNQNCGVSFWIPSLEHDKSYIISVKSRNLRDRGLYFWLENLNNKRAAIETYLPRKDYFTTSYIIQPPMESDGLAYSLHFDNLSIGPEDTINDLSEIVVQPVPYELLTGLRFSKEVEPAIYNDKLQVTHPNPAFYEVSGALGGQTVVLSQAYDDGWRAYEVSSKTPLFLAPFVARPAADHILVNNWSNGWVLPENTSNRIVLLYWPQYAVFGGYMAAFLTLLGLGGYAFLRSKAR